MRYLLIFLLLTSCLSDAQIDKKKAFTIINSGGVTSFPASSGITSFAMNDIPGINIPELVIAWDLPVGSNLPLLVFVHGWAGGGQVTGNLDPAAISFLHSQGIGILGVGLRGRNTGASYANDGAQVEIYRDAFGQEAYDEYASVKYFLENIVTAGKINEEKIIRYGISGAGFGTPVKIPDLYSLIVSWYAMAKYGTYVGDPTGSFTGWYTDDINYQGSIQVSVGAAPFGSVGYSAGISDSRHMSRDHISAARNIMQKVYLYHDTGDNTVKVDHSDLLEDEFITHSKTYVYNRSTNGDYAHGNADLIFGEYPGLGNSLDWVDDAKTLTRPTAPTTGTFRVPGFLVLDKSDLKVWIKKYHINNVASPAAGALDNQGKNYAATINYNLSTDTYEVTPIIPPSGDQFFFIEITRGLKTVQALISSSDVVTLTPKTLNKSPLNLSSYNWKCFFDLSDADSYVLDETGDVSNLIDLTGNGKNFYQHTRATRVPVSASSYLDNGVYQIKGGSGTLAAQSNDLLFSGQFTIVCKYDFDAATVASVNDNLLGRGAGSSSLVNFGTFSGKLQVSFKTESSTFASNQTPSNSNVGVQTMVVTRNASNVVTIKIKNSTNTYTYDMGIHTGNFDLRVIGSSAAFTKQFNGDIYKFAAVDALVSDTDVTTILDNF